jgi:hypothetical protein
VQVVRQLDIVGKGEVNRQTFVRLDYTGDLEGAINKQIE